MNAFEMVQAAAKEVGVNAYPHTYNGKDKKWITYQMITERPDLFGDDSPEAVVSRVQINLFIPENINYLDLKNSLRKALENQGFTVPEVVNSTIETDTKIRHITMECETDENY